MNRATRIAAIEATAPDLLAYFKRRLPAEDAADAVGDVLTVAWRRIDQMPEDAHGSRLWLFGVARRILLQSFRSATRQTELTARLRALAVESSAPADAGLAVRDALDRLTEEHAEVLRLVHWDGFTLTDAARHLGIGDSTVRSRYHRAKAALRAELGLHVG
ncbi:RNA polymerase sigma factor [Microbacterium bovistercoris]|uniref:RNA polymerase sigma factor n=1 Tax=Microbacterium bovistercoris TaxID=2293570 RepID=UPI001FE2C539|nr:sigma-70 family RNA polymerase sigma factor [Microbacterium bovistercoris]